MFVKCNPYIYLLSSFMCPAGTRLVFIKTKRNKGQQEKDKAKTKVNFSKRIFLHFLSTSLSFLPQIFKKLRNFKMYWSKTKIYAQMWTINAIVNIEPKYTKKINSKQFIIQTICPQWHCAASKHFAYIWKFN